MLHRKDGRAAAMIAAAGFSLVLLAAVGMAGADDVVLAFSHADHVETLSGPGSSTDVSLASLKTVNSLVEDGRGGMFLSEFRDGGAGARIFWLRGENLTAVSFDEEDGFLGLVEDMAFDPSRRLLWLADSKSSSVLSLDLGGEDGGWNRLSTAFTFKNGEKPKGVTFHRCSGTLSWAVDSRSRPRIESFNPSDKTTAVVAEGENMERPRSVAVDPADESRLYWLDSRRDGSYSVETALSDGTGRETVCSGRGQMPYGLAVGADSLFWTDGQNMAVWKTAKTPIKDCHPEVVRRLTLSRPLGIAILNQEQPECQPGESAAAVAPKLEALDESPCDGYCLNGGNCSVTGLGAPHCRCERHHEGERCQTRNCQDFCLGGGICSLDQEGQPQCRCPDGMSGSRCQEFAVISIRLPSASLSEASSAVAANYLFVAIPLAVSLLVVVIGGVVCVKAAADRASRQEQFSPRRMPDHVLPPEPFVVCGRKDNLRTFSGPTLGVLGVEKEEAPCGNQVVIDLEDCCQMTLCDRPCVEWSSRHNQATSPRKGFLSRSNAATVALCSPHKSSAAGDVNPDSADSVRLLTEQEE